MTATISCAGEQRRQKARDRGLNGIDFIEVLCPDQNLLCVHLFSKDLERISPANIRIDGGTRIRGIRAVSAKVLRREDPELEDCLRIKLNKAGDFSTYTLSIVESRDGDPTDHPLAGFDPFYASADFSFKTCCDSDLDCRRADPCPSPKADEPVIDYLNKDYAGFRQLILDRMALIMPDWKERHIPDLGIALVELLAYTGDYLSYRQDAVATEAYIGTARHRISVRRHARLVDYAMHEGCNARTFVCLRTSQDVPDTLHPADMFFVTRCDGLDIAEGTVITPEHLRNVPVTEYEVFEPLFEKTDPIPLFEAHNVIPFYTWENRMCCLPKGSTHATLKDGWAEDQHAETVQGTASDAIAAKKGAADEPSDLGEPSAQRRRKLDNLKKGDVLVFEEIIGPGTGNPADASPINRQAVRLTSVERDVDPLNDQPVVEIDWAPEDALAFQLCLSTRLPSPDCSFITDISVARGNVVAVDHGRSTESVELGMVAAAKFEGRCDCHGSTDAIYLPARFSAVLPERPVTFREAPNAHASASGMLVQDERRALAQVKLTGTALSSPGAKGSDGLWLPVRDALDSWEDDQVFVVEVNDEGCACIRFGDGEQGKMPEVGISFSARFRVGNGPVGNVGAGTIRYLGLRNARLSGISVSVRNPLPAIGGTAAEPVEEVRLLAPHAYRRTLERAILATDYAEIAARNKKIQNASAALRWTGSWYEVRVAADPVGKEELMPELDKELERELHRFRRMGHDVEVVTSDYVPLDLTLTVCADDDFLKEHVKAALLERFSNRVLADGSRGFFHPDRLTFGAGVAVTSLMAEALAVPGVSCVVVNLRRLGDGPEKGISDGVLKLGAMEIAQLDNDPSFPEHGKLTLIMGGGR